MEGSALSLPWQVARPCIDGGSPARRQPFFPSSASAMPSTTHRDTLNAYLAQSKKDQIWQLVYNWQNYRDGKQPVVAPTQ